MRPVSGILLALMASVFYEKEWYFVYVQVAGLVGGSDEQKTMIFRSCVAARVATRRTKKKSPHVVAVLKKASHELIVYHFRTLQNARSV